MLSIMQIQNRLKNESDTDWNVSALYAEWFAFNSC